MFPRSLLEAWRRQEPAPDPDTPAAQEAGERVLTRDELDRQAWIGVGLDGTLAHGRTPAADHSIGDPVPLMVTRVKHWIEQGYKVKILTARAARAENIPAIRNWLQEHGLPALEVTHRKDLHMVEMWDDRAIQVVGNTGRPVGKSRIAPKSPHALSQPPPDDAAPSSG